MSATRLDLETTRIIPGKKYPFEELIWRMEVGRAIIGLNETVQQALDEVLIAAKEMIQHYPHGALASLIIDNGHFELIAGDGRPEKTSSGINH
ncbi:MAG TPA: hypothetical protein DCX25_00925 [Candidatus Pacebacteria bacterium]|nr:MAG: hypothetical protein UX00_C0015G0013 [Microgenomates group bacterium GW2011_GWB1_45_17]KKU22768.1 MAG: hypothetical protein UX35_C0016G0012 [Microgenomates group bacterium GW2011_GWA1_46_15]KKU24030.1 MAG: hypothetical protein UX36_C0002G0013 [Microgenomates group bacterium GW2011_GWC1_46_15]HAV14876.1 hypothetical protein [Candidatus Paceibacterota bacterium]HCR11628.1 hypothetical protein [Candidatus Paceibacterota bacterium]